MLNNGKNTIKKGTVIFSQGEAISQIGLLLSGKVIAQNENMKFIRENGSYLALNEIYQDKYNATYIAAEDSVVYALPANNDLAIRNIISKSTDYRAIMIASQFKFAVEISTIHKALIYRAKRFYEFAKKSYEIYGNICKAFGKQILAINELEDMQIFESAVSNMYDDKLEYYKEGAKIPLGAHKMYFSYSEEMAYYQVNEIISMASAYKDDCVAVIDYIKKLLDIVGLRQGNSLFDIIYIKGLEIRKEEEIPVELQVLFSNIINEIKFQYDELKKQVSQLPQLDLEVMESKMTELSSEEYIKNEQKTNEEREVEIKHDIASLTNSMEQVIRYGELEEEEADILRENIEILVNAPDRLSVEDNVKKAKKAITPIIFNLYLKCYRQIKKHTIAPTKAVELFLNFGYLDERLLEQEHLEFLCSIEPERNEGPCKVYTMVEWLDMIKEGKREPSKSEFDEDYEENLRSLKKQGEINESQQKEWLNDMDRRVEYEIMNMQKTNTRALYGQPSSYMPVLYKEAMYGYLDKILVTKKKINECVVNLMKIDYSVFYRETVYSNNKLKISNEVIMKEIYPDMILFPIFGINAAMWQEVGSKNKATPGRFCFPIMTNSNIEDLMIKIFGRFRWELCRSIQGTTWNDIKVKSLTSEYMDYIQFYRKNRDLSDEAKEKMKLQIQKGRNNSREIFLIDYEIWIKSEANASMKLNKFVRELIATYCPFEKTIREKLNVQRPYEMAMARHFRNSQKKAQEFDLKIKAIQKNSSEVPSEMMDTYMFFADN